MKINHAWRLVPSALALACLVACGGGSDDTATATATSDPDAGTSAFPTGVSVASPAGLDDASSVVAAYVPSGATLTADWARAAWAALTDGDLAEVARLAANLMPMGRAMAAPVKVPEASVVASEIEAVASGTRTLHAVMSLRSMNHLFSASASNAECFGPTVDYAVHDHDGTSGELPSGDLGMWTDDDTEGLVTQPCASAQLNARLQPVKKQFRQGMMLMAGMRRAVATESSLTLPAAGASTDLTSAFAARLALLVDADPSDPSPLPPTPTVESATIALNGDGSVYTYRLVLSRGTGANAQTAEVVVRHTPGSASDEFGGLLHITVAGLSPDMNMGCSDERSGSDYKVASVTSVRYQRGGTHVEFGARSGNYCGAPTSTASTSHLGDLAGVTSEGELDPDVYLAGSARGGAKGWRGNFSKFAGDFDSATLAGDFLYAWQAGTGDDKSRGFAVHSDYNSSTEVRTMNAYYAYLQKLNPPSADPTDSHLLGMICNWAGPGNSHVPAMTFQSQALELTASGTGWQHTGLPASSRISYAPTTSCSSTGSMTYDRDGDGTIGVSEGSSVTHALDALTGANTTVHDELLSRDYVTPGYF